MKSKRDSICHRQAVTKVIFEALIFLMNYLYLVYSICKAKFNKVMNSILVYFIKKVQEDALTRGPRLSTVVIKCCTYLNHCGTASCHIGC
jgi:hypothetical protein